jgi:predicted Zn-dependent peptidase
MNVHKSMPWLLALLIFGGALCCQALMKLPPQKALLPNGLRVVVAEDKSLPVAAVVLSFNVGIGCGNVIEPNLLPVLSNVRDVCDTQTMSRFDLNALLEEHGCTVMYSKDPHQNYISIQGPSESLEVMLKQVHALGFQLKITQENLDKSKELVGNQLKERLRFPLSSGYLYEGARCLLYRATSLATSMYGSPESLGKLTLDHLQHLLEKAFVPNNAVLVVVGNVDSSGVFRKSNEIFGQLKAGIQQASGSVCADGEVEPMKEHREFLDIKETEVILSFEAPSLKDTDRPVMEMWGALLRHSNNSWVQKFEKRFPEIRQFSGYYHPWANGGLFSFSFKSADPGIDRVVMALLEDIANLPLSAPGPQELARLVTIRKALFNRDNEMRMNQALEIGVAELAKDFTLYTSLPAALEKVSTDDMVRVGKKVFSTQKYGLKVAHPLTCQLKTEAKAKQGKLANGMTVNIKPYVGSELVGVNLRLDINPSFDPKGKEGLVSLLNALFQENITGGKDGSTLGNQLDEIGGKIHFINGNDSLVAICYANKDRLEDLLKILRQVIFRAEWTESALAQTIARRKQDLENWREIPEQLLTMAFFKAAYPGSFMERLDQFNLTERDVTLADVKDFHGRWVVPELTSCTIVGNIDTEKAFIATKEIFENIPANKPAPIPDFPAGFSAPITKTEAIEITVNGPMDSAYLFVGFRLPSLQNMFANETTKTDLAACTVIMHLLTWSRNGLVSREMVAKGLANEIKIVQLSTGSFYSCLLFAVRVPKAKLAEAKTALKGILEGLQNRVTSQQEITTAGKIVDSLLLTQMERTFMQAASLSGFLRVGMGMDYLEQFSKWNRSLTPEQIQSVLKRYFQHYIMIIGHTN